MVPMSCHPIWTEIKLHKKVGLRTNAYKVDVETCTNKDVNEMSRAEPSRAKLRSEVFKLKLGDIIRKRLISYT